MDAPSWDFALHLHAHTFYSARRDFISRDSRFESWVLVAAEAGRFSYEIETEQSTASFGDLVFVAPRGKFQRAVVSDDLTYHVLQFSLGNRPGEEVEEDAKNVWQTGKWPVRDTTRLASMFAGLRHLITRSDAWSTRRRTHWLEELLHLAWETRVAPKYFDPLMQDAARYLRERAGTVFSMSEVAQQVGLGPVQFTRRFRAAFGQNPIEFLTEVRLASAQQLLVETSCTLDEIAERCGWASGAYLSNVFARHLHTTPGRFRRLHRV